VSGTHFICYSHVDGTEYADRLEAALESGNPPIKTWRDKTKLVSGAQTWRAQVDSALRDCDSLLFLMTPDSTRNESECLSEWECVAKQYRKPTVLLQMDQSAEHYALRRYQHISFRGDFDALLAEVRTTLGRLFSPEGILDTTRFQLAEAQRDLSGAVDAPLRSRLAAYVSELEAEVTRLQEVVDDPVAMRLASQERTAAAIAAERRELSRPAPRSNLAVVNSPPLEPPAYFRGRLTEAQQLRASILEPSCRVITLFGRGGAGKSALACKVIHELEQDGSSPGVAPKVVYLGSSTRAITFSNLYADLCRLLPPDRSAAIHEQFKDAKMGVDAKTRILLDEFLSDRVIVLMDDFSRVLNSKSFGIDDPELKTAMETVLSHQHHGVTFVLTSRYVPSDLLKISFGRQKRLELSRGISVEEASEVLREIDSDGQLTLHDADPQVLKEVWNRTDGNPGALEKLAGLLAANPHNVLADLLADLPEDLTEVLVGEAYASLERPTQAALQAVSIIATTYFPRVSAAAVDSLLEPYFPGVDSRRALNQLVDMYLIRLDRQSKTYIVNPIEADYARSRLPRGEACEGTPVDTASPPFTQIALLRRAIDYYTKLFKASDQWKSKEDVEPQLAAVELWCAVGEYDRASDLLSDFDVAYLLRWGHDSLVATLRERLEGHLREPRRERYNAAVLGISYANLGFIGKSLACHERALDLARQTHSDAAIAVELGCLGGCYRDIGQSSKGVELLSEALALFRRLKNRAAEGEALSNLGICHADLGEFKRAAEFCRESIRVAQEAGNRPREANRQANLATVLLELGEHGEALEAALRAASLAANCDQPYFRVEAMRALALVRLAAGDLPAARAAAQNAVLDGVNLSSHAAWVIFGAITALAGERDVAADAFAKAAQHAERILERDSRLFAALDAKGLAHSGVALVLKKSEDLAQAEAAFHAARALTLNSGTIAQVKRVLDALARIDTEQALARIRVVALGPEEAISTNKKKPKIQVSMKARREKANSGKKA